MYLVEEFFYAACELEKFDWAKFFLQMIRSRFGKSVKTFRLLGSYHEAIGDPVKAQEIYLEMIEENPDDKQTVKRLVCLFRDMDMLGQAIAVLTKFVECN